MPFLTNEQLNKQYTIPIEYDLRGPLPLNNRNYDRIRNLENIGFSFTAKDLLHAIGIKTASLPIAEYEEALYSAHLYTNLLDFDSHILSFKENLEIDSDLKTPRSQELGVAMTCLFASTYYGIQWDSLEPIVVQRKGKMFDYRGVSSDNLSCIFESKGTGHRGNQRGQIESGLEKKQDHHNNNENHDVELIISTFIGSYGRNPRILIADPIFKVPEYTFTEDGNLYYRMRHYSRVLRFAGLSDISYHLYQNAKKFKSTKELRKNLSQKYSSFDEFKFNGQTYIGNWSNEWFSAKSDLINRNKYFNKKYKKLLKYEKFNRSNNKIFQGIDANILKFIINGDYTIIDDYIKSSNNQKMENNISIFSDGSIQVIENS